MSDSSKPTTTIINVMQERLLEGNSSTGRDGIRGIARALAQPVTCLGIAMLVFIYCAVAYLLIADRKAASDDAVRRGGNIVRIFDQAYSGNFKSVDAGLQFLRTAYQANPSTFDLNALVRGSPYGNELIFDFVITDASGRIVDTSFSKNFVGADRSQEEAFRAHINSSGDELFIGKPLVLKSGGRRGMVLSRRITAPDGTFAGVIAALIDPSQLGKIPGAIDLGPDGTFALTGFDGVVRTRAVNGKIDWETIGRQVAPWTGVLAYAAQAKSGAFWNTPGLFDNVSRLISFRVLESLPLVAVATMSEAEVYRRANENARIYWGIALVLTVAILIAIGFGALRERRLIATTLEMKRAQEALQRSQERYALVESAVNDGIFDRNLLTDEIYLSPRWKNILGYADDEIPNVISSFFDRLHPDDRANLAAAVRAHLEENKPHSLDFRLRCKNGDYRWVHSRGKALRDATNRPVRMLGTITDISERKQAEASIEESRRNLARAETMALLGHYKFEQGSTAVTWSNGTYHIMGKLPGSFTPTLSSVLELIHPDDQPALVQYRCDVLAGLEPPRMTLRVVKDDGQIIYVDCWSKPIRASDGTVTGMFGTLQDVTARKQAEALIEESLNNLARAETMALLGHHRIEKASNRLTWSDGVYRILGKSPASFTPTLNATLELIHPDDRPALKHYRRDAMAGLERPPITLRAVRDDGRIIYVENWLVPIRASDGSVTEVFGTVQDVTARKLAEAALAQTNQELEMRVAERTAELAQEMRRREEAQMTLAQSQKMEAVGQLTAGIAHDFNNLLAVIGGSLGFVEGAAARGLTAEPELIDAALRATRRGRELVQRLLAFARQSPLKAEPTAIDQLVLDTLRLLQRTLGQGIEIVTNLDAQAAVVSVDRNQLANALLNLALNARDAMPEGGQLAIATTCQPAKWAAVEGSTRWPTGEEVCITIADTGTGMTEEVRNRVFEPFFTTKPDGLGSGLGLSMVQGFVEQSGGHIEIDSAARRGTTITIHLPSIAAASQPEETETADRSSAPAKEKTVLLVEDDPDVRVVTAAQLKQLGYKVHAVANGMEAIDVIASPANIDITLTDIVLPGGLDGVTLLKEAMQARPRMGVLCMSGYDPTQKNRKWLKVQNIEFLEKPFSSARLAQALDAVLAH